MKKICLLLTVALLLPLPVIAQTTAPVATRPRLKLIGLMGAGIAVSQDDPMDFVLVRAGVGTVTLRLRGEEKEFTVGVLLLDRTKYKLKEIEIGNETISAVVYSNATVVGKMDVSRIDKGFTVVWAGVLTVNDKNYYMYILNVKRPFKPYEIKERVASYCKQHPRDPNCRKKIIEYCEDHPNDRRCIAVVRNYCTKHLKDERCREVVKEWCKENSRAPVCRRIKVGVRTLKQFCEENPNAMVCRRFRVRQIIGTPTTTQKTTTTIEETTTTQSEETSVVQESTTIPKETMAGEG